MYKSMMDLSKEIENIGKEVNRKFDQMMKDQIGRDIYQNQDQEMNKNRYLELEKRIAKKIWNRTQDKPLHKSDKFQNENKTFIPPIEEESETEFHRGLVEIFTNTNFSVLESMLEIYRSQNRKSNMKMPSEELTQSSEEMNQKEVKFLHCNQNHTPKGQGNHHTPRNQEDLTPRGKCNTHTPRSQCIKLHIPKKTTQTCNSQVEEIARDLASDSSIDSFNSLLSNIDMCAEHELHKYKLTTGNKKNQCIKLNIPKFALEMEIFLKSAEKTNRNTNNANNADSSDDIVEDPSNNIPQEYYQDTKLIQRAPEVNNSTHDDPKHTDEKKVNTKGIYVESHPMMCNMEDILDTKLNGDKHDQPVDEMYKEQMKEYIDKACNVLVDLQTETTNLNHLLNKLKELSKA